MELTDKFTFGKFKGRTLGSVIMTNPQYVQWATYNVEWFELSEEADKCLRARIDMCPGRDYMPDELDSEFQFMDFWGNS